MTDALACSLQLPPDASGRAESLPCGSGICFGPVVYENVRQRERYDGRDVSGTRLLMTVRSGAPTSAKAFEAVTGYYSCALDCA